MTSILWLYFQAFLSSSSEFELRLEKEYRASSLNRAIIKIARASRVRVRAAARYVPSIYKSSKSGPKLKKYIQFLEFDEMDKVP